MVSAHKFLPALVRFDVASYRPVLQFILKAVSVRILGDLKVHNRHLTRYTVLLNYGLRDHASLQGP